jgi:hypothetical protein
VAEIFFQKLATLLLKCPFAKFSAENRLRERYPGLKRTRTDANGIKIKIKIKK